MKQDNDLADVTNSEKTGLILSPQSTTLLLALLQCLCPCGLKFPSAAYRGGLLDIRWTKHASDPTDLLIKPN